MCALTIAPPSTPPDSYDDPSWGARAARVRVKRLPDMSVLPLSFRDLQVSPHDVTTVGEAFARCSPEEMLTAVMRHEAGWRIPVDRVGSRAHHMLMGKIAGALEAMRSLEEAVGALSPSNEGMIGPLFRFAAAEGGVGLESRVEAAVFSREDAALLRECLASGMKRVCTWDELRAIRCDTGASVVPERIGPDALHESHTVLARMPWERILALPLWLPSDLGESERQAVLAKVFWSMTYRGFTRSDVRQGAWDTQLRSELSGRPRMDPAPWPTDPVLAVLDHNCWIDTLEAWNALFAIISSGETRP